jgi:NRPS condensation-like uncharacterized protein
MILRKLSKHELSQLAWHTIHFSIDISSNFNLEIFQKAAIHTIKSVPLAHSKVVKKNDEFYFKSIEAHDVPFNKIQLLNDCDYHSVYKELINTAVDSTSSQFEITVIQFHEKKQYAIIFSLAHSIVSGRTGVEFIYHILNNYHSIQNGKNMLVEELPLNQSMATLSSIQSQNIKPGVYADPDKLSQTFSPIPLSSLENNPHNFLTDFIDIPISSNDFTNIKVACRANGVSINSYLSACQLMAAIETYPESRQSKYVSHNLAVDPRKIIQNSVSKGNLMQFSYSGIFFFEIAQITDVWELAKDFSDRVEQYLSSDEMHATIKSIESSDYSVSNPNVPILDEDFHWTTCNSNLGLVHLGENSNTFNISNFKFIVNRINGSHLLFISTFDNTLSLRYAFSTPRYSRENIRTLADTMVKTIINNVST